MKKLATLFFVFAIMACANSQKGTKVIIHTNFGDMTAVLYDETPLHRDNFLKLANSHFYDSLLFHRVIDGFMIQGGDPESKNAPAGRVSLVIPYLQKLIILSFTIKRELWLLHVSRIK
jgi:hypothetical protein